MATNRTGKTASTKHTAHPAEASARLIYVGDLRPPERAQLARQALEKLRRTDPRRVRLLEVGTPGVCRNGGITIEQVNSATALATVRWHARTGTLHLPLRHPLLGEIALHALASGCAPEALNGIGTPPDPELLRAICNEHHGFIALDHAKAESPSPVHAWRHHSVAA